MLLLDHRKKAFTVKKTLSPNWLTQNFGVHCECYTDRDCVVKMDLEIDFVAHCAIKKFY